MVKIGMLICDRYEILEKIGTGGMADVYKAKDHKLNRFVAIKVLKQEFSENTNFVSKFRIEAQATAGLMHPNIVNVYDVGEENGIYYIVMELVEGITLKRYIEKKARLSIKETISIAIQISAGIEAAHNNHIIHRDIKPQNIIISKDGKVKITDFGIAKAATSNTITSNVMGSVHYTSPEQARGGYSDEKSDVYSLGITLFEMLTGRVPFNGDTTVAIAIKHIQEEMPSPREFVPEIPISVEKIVLKCTQKSPDRRYQSMGLLTDDLKRSLIHPEEDFVDLENYDRVGETKAISLAGNSTIRRNEQQKAKRTEEEVTREDRYVPEKRMKKSAPIIHERTTGPAGRGQQGASSNQQTSRPETVNRRSNTNVVSNPQNNTYQKNETAPQKKADNKFDKTMITISIALAVVIGVVILYLVGSVLGIFGGNSNKDTMVTMPDVIDAEYTEAVTILENMGLKVDIDFVESADVDANRIIDTNVEEGESVAVGTQVQITVSTGAAGVKVPSVVGISLAEATSTLKKEGFVVSTVEAYSAEVSKNNVISQEPKENTKATRGAEVVLTISAGEEEVFSSMPNVLNRTVDEARKMLVDAGYTVNSVTDTYSDEYAAGYICYQSFSEGTNVKQGTGVDLKRSLGPNPEGNNTSQSGAGVYQFTDEIKAPTSVDYVYGTEVTVTVKSATGEQLWKTTTYTFPLGVNVTGIATDYGTVLLEYLVTGEATTVTDPNTGEVTTVPGNSEVKTEERTVYFTLGE